MKTNYEIIVFLQDEEAREALDLYSENGQEAALRYLEQWHYPGGHETTEKHPRELAGTTDHVFHFDVPGGTYFMNVNPLVGYIGLYWGDA